MVLVTKESVGHLGVHENDLINISLSTEMDQS